MKKVLGLDLGTNSIGWALVNEATKEEKKEGKSSEIIKLGVRVNPLTVDEKTNFEKGRPLSTNADRTLKRSARRNLQRYKLRRRNLIEILIKNGFITKDTPLTETGKDTTHQTLKLRAKSAKEKVDLKDFAKILLTINKKRGYKSSRKVNSDEDGLAIDGMAVAKHLYEQNLTPGQYVLNLLQKNKKYVPDFYRSDLQEEFKNIWNNQKTYYFDILTDTLFEELKDKNKSQTWAICKKPFDIAGIKQIGKASDKRLERYKWRTEGLTQKLNLEYLAIALQEINNDINKSSGYLGAISDRSKELFFNKETVGENLYRQLVKTPHTSLRNQVFYRQDYLDEFETIWETQAKFYPQLTHTLKEEIRDVIIFYQRKLKSQKSLISFCQFESWEQTYIEKETGKSKTRTVGRKVIPKSSPLFQEFKIWQNLNSLEFRNSDEGEIIEFIKLDEDIRQTVFEELNLRGNLKPNDVLKILGNYISLGKVSQWKCNFEEIEGNRTNAALYNVYQIIAENEGYGFDWAKKTASEINKELKNIFPQLGIDASILDFDFTQANFDKQTSYQLWHLLYSAEEDFKISEEDKVLYGNSSVSLKKKLHQKYGFKPEYTKLLTNISLQPDYGNLSAKAICNILPYLKENNVYSEACDLTGYNHSNFLTAEEQAKRPLKPILELLKKNSLRNPVVEKILNQMVNVVNQVIETYGKPDEIRIELTRELKKSAKERANMTKSIADATRRNDDYRKTIIKEFGIPNPTKSDVVRYRLWQELASRGYKDIFTDTEIKPQELFSNKIDIEHIIPKALLFDDSFSNKTLAFKKDNLKKANRTAYDFIANDYAPNLENYIERVESLHKDRKITRAKRNKLLMLQSKLPDGFIERDLRNSQYITKEAKKMLYEVCRTVVSTSGSITDKLREDWDLINVMKELNFPKYKALGLTEKIERYDIGAEKMKEVEIIEDWNKRNDHRHHAIDALTVAFSTHSHIQYLNHLNARRDEGHKKHAAIIAIESTITEKEGNKKRRFIAPLPNFRLQAKEHIESILVSFKNKNKVVTNNINKTKRIKKDKFNTKVQLTPRGQLHKETIYGKIKQPLEKHIKLNKSFTLEQAKLIIDKRQREKVLNHLEKYAHNSDIAFNSKTLKKNPLLISDEPLKEVLCFEEVFTIRKDISYDNFKNEKQLDKVIDEKVKQALKERINQYNGDFREAFSDIERNPIWLNKAKGICVKRATIKGVSNAEPLHTAKNHLGEEVLTENKEQIPVDYVSTGNNHHVAIYEDEDGNLQEKVVSFYEAVIRVNEGLPIIDKEYNKSLGWTFKFTMKQNEMFVFPSEDFNPTEIDLLDQKNASLISPNLFRVQKFTIKDYFFRHHLETTVENNNTLKNTTWRREGLSGIYGIIKIRLNHLGEIVQVGEY
ncbi:CRISPR-associated protein Cas9/Csn1, subtype II/NMEMI [Galbibacter orientalis DSM 19592]|uniref:CRISPR-associated endonuclease Cas9 n=1 Tax=Galbibacter orientalis DSM 19592 TaxID=926559 RepID=I3C2S4_9FLAO|nr:type II CRISPR RNA-guided endonuclease Cas9 [Galbibacter orientalis]EIJ37917.1 CRISPR-associated protein Cas9/Csn1, subtype II/NMEMI [Galbibacter orientalis DSM 19592]